MRVSTILFAVVVGVVSFCSTFALAQCPGLFTSPISNDNIPQNGISITFQSSHTMGQYANGDWWVVGPVTIVSTLPAFDGKLHGFEINPSSKSESGFDYRLDGFNASLVPNLPVVVQPGSSIVKAESIAPYDDMGCRPCLLKAVVFTVVDAVPPTNGLKLLRPNYFGSIKYSFNVDSIDYSYLPKISPSPALSSVPDLQWIIDTFAPEFLKLDHHDWVGRYYHPKQNMPDYGADIALEYNKALLRLLYDDVESTAEGKCALYRFLEVGIDLIAAMKQGNMCFPSNGGHNLGRKLPVIFAAVLLGDTAAINLVKSKSGRSGDCFHEDLQVTENGLYGDDGSEDDYWKNKRDDTGSRTVKDPYGFIDGGFVPGESYQFCCNAQNWKAEAIVLNLVPKFREIWNYEPFMNHVTRWVNIGAWSQPDPCAPVIGLCEGGSDAGRPCTSASLACYNGGGECKAPENDPNYGVKYGPDGKGGCIKDTDPSDGIGRNPQMHGANRDGGYYGDRFFSELHDYYFNSTYFVNLTSVLSPSAEPVPALTFSPVVYPPQAAVTGSSSHTRVFIALYLLAVTLFAF